MNSFIELRKKHELIFKKRRQSCYLFLRAAAATDRNHPAFYSACFNLAAMFDEPKEEPGDL